MDVAQRKMLRVALNPKSLSLFTQPVNGKITQNGKKHPNNSEKGDCSNFKKVNLTKNILSIHI